jgi:hypothetical protein
MLLEETESVKPSTTGPGRLGGRGALMPHHDVRPYCILPRSDTPAISTHMP